MLPFDSPEVAMLRRNLQKRLRNRFSWLGKNPMDPQYLGGISLLIILAIGCSVYDDEAVTPLETDNAVGDANSSSFDASGDTRPLNNFDGANVPDGANTPADAADAGNSVDSSRTDSNLDAYAQGGCTTDPNYDAEVAACVLPNASAKCEENQCKIDRCVPLYDNCDDDETNGCETKLDSLTNCGGCEVECDGLSCAGGVCTTLDCGPGLGDCNNNPDDGCETSLTTLTDCGLCGSECAVTNASARCAEGECEFLTCNTGFADCDDDLSNGCETPLDTLTDCGACGQACTAPNGEPSCAGGVCSTVTCGDGYANCNGDDGDGCEASLTSVEHCGSCDPSATCGPLDHATATCATGTCQIESCDTGYDDCDVTPSNGCETPLNTNQNCGACRVACGFPNAVTTCETGTCEVSPCNEGYRDCNGDEEDGCEADLNTAQTCGSCTNDCTTLPNVEESSCSGSICSVETCDEGWGDCTNDPGCETPLNTTSNCSECGDICSGEGGTAVCNEGVCDTICDLTGTFALKIRTRVTWSGTSWTRGSGGGTYYNYSWGKLQVSQSGTDITGTLIECGKDEPAVASSVISEDYKISYSDAIFNQVPSNLPSVSIAGTLSDSSPGATLALNQTAMLMGGTMNDPINDAWPSGLTQDDMDGDGKPGVTAPYLNGGSYIYPRTSSLYFGYKRADLVYLATRVVFTLNGTLTSCTQSTGSASVTQVNTRIFGCNLSSSSSDCSSSEGNFLRDNHNVLNPGTATYEIVKIGDGATCSDARSALP